MGHNRQIDGQLLIALAQGQSTLGQQVADCVIIDALHSRQAFHAAGNVAGRSRIDLAKKWQDIEAQLIALHAVYKIGAVGNKILTEC